MSIKKAVKELLGLVPARRMLTVFPDDVFIASYPKSGNTWVRFLVANYLAQQNGIKVGFVNIENLVPDIYQSSDKKLLGIPAPRILKSHEVFDPRYKNVIYIIRNPLDVFTSYYYFSIKTGQIPEDTSASHYFDVFISNGIADFGTWYENVSSWTIAGDRKSLVIKYEDLLNDPYTSLENIVTHLGYDVDAERISAAINASSFEKMGKMEKEQSKDWKPVKNTDQNIPFVRSGKSGGWKDLLTNDDVKKIPVYWQGLLSSFGYET